MKTIKFTILFAISIFFIACGNNSEKTEKTSSKTETTQKTEGPNRIEILDFYGKHRCTTCINIEANTRYTLDNFFKDEVEKGIVVFKTIDFDNADNEEIVTEYMAYGTSLFFNIIKDGKEKHIDLTEFAFKWGNEQVEYSMQLEEKIREELKKL